jgi:integrase
VLSTEELARVWRTTDPASDFGAIVRLLLLTGQRREEVAAMAWSELDLGRGRWILPAQRTKNRRPHEVPLSSQALAILAARPRRPGRDLVFGEGKGPFSGWSSAKKMLDSRIAATGGALPAWRLHDLRRSVVTHMAEIGIAPHIIEAVVNHVSGHKGGVAGVYNRATYAAEKRAVLEAWAHHLEALSTNTRQVEVERLHA